MRLQAGPRKDEAGYEREEDAAHQARHPGRPIGTPKVDYRRAAQAGISHVFALPAGNIREAARRLKALGAPEWFRRERRRRRRYRFRWRVMGFTYDTLAARATAPGCAAVAWRRRPS